MFQEKQGVQVPADTVQLSANNQSGGNRKGSFNCQSMCGYVLRAWNLPSAKPKGCCPSAKVPGSQWIQAKWGFGQNFLFFFQKLSSDCWLRRLWFCFLSTAVQLGRAPSPQFCMFFSKPPIQKLWSPAGGSLLDQKRFSLSYKCVRTMSKKCDSTCGYFRNKHWTMGWHSPFSSPTQAKQESFSECVSHCFGNETPHCFYQLHSRWPSLFCLRGVF